jgi:hypothetical protein
MARLVTLKVHWDIPADVLQLLPSVISNGPCIRNFTLMVLPHWTASTSVLNLLWALGNLAALSCLTLMVSGTDVGDNEMEVLGQALVQLVQLRTLELLILQTDATSRGMQALTTGVGGLVSLKHLSVTACGSFLVGFNAPASLRSLSLCFLYNDDDMQNYTADLCKALHKVPKLQHLSINICNSEVACALADTAEFVERLAIQLADNLRVADLDLLGMGLGQRSALQVLLLGFNGAMEAKAEQFTLLSSLSQAPALVTMGLGLRNCGLGNPEPIIGINSFPSLQAMRLDLASNNISDTGAMNLASSIADAPCLVTLHLDVADNCISDHGVACFGRPSRTLRRYVLNLSHNDAVTLSGARAVQVALLSRLDQFATLAVYTFGLVPNADAIIRSGQQYHGSCVTCEIPGLICEDCYQYGWGF